MNFKNLEPIAGDGTSKTVDVPRGARLIIYADGGDVELRDAPSGDFLPIPEKTLVRLGESLGQTLHLKANTGTTIRLALA